MEQHLVMGSRLRLTSWRHLPAFLRATRQINRQLARSSGRVDHALRAQFGSLTFWTSSVWTDRDTLDAFVRSEPHRSVMIAMRERGAMRDGAFAFWEVPAGSRAPGWEEVEARILDATSRETTAKPAASAAER